VPKVLHLRTVTGHGGGPEKTLLNSQRFIGDGYTLQLAYIRPVGDDVYDLPQRAAQLGVSFVDIPERGPLDFRTVRRLSQLIKDSRPDILHAHDYKTNVLAVLLGKWHRLPVMTTVHGYVSQSKKLNLYYRIDRWALRRMDHIVVVSEDLLHRVKQWGIPSTRCSLVENAIDVEQYIRHLPTAEAKCQLGISPRSLVIGAVGRLAAEKALDRLILAVDRLLRTGRNLELIIIGEGAERPRLEALVARLDHGDSIRLLGYRTDTINLYQAMDVLVLCSLREAFPNVLLEALATEVPVVATPVAGVPQIIQHEKNGLLVQPDNVDQLTAALERLASDVVLRKRLAAAGRQVVEEKYSFEVRMRKIRAIYDRLLGREASASLVMATTNAD
jgi:glycosyltransferase involved in cell wall biosynthesis